jgi:hypothetical protein
MDGWLAVDRVLNRQTGSDLVVASLYRDLKRSQEVAFDSGYGSDSSKGTYLILSGTRASGWRRGHTGRSIPLTSARREVSQPACLCGP